MSEQLELFTCKFEVPQEGMSVGWDNETGQTISLHQEGDQWVFKSNDMVLWKQTFAPDDTPFLQIEKLNTEEGIVLKNGNEWAREHAAVMAAMKPKLPVCKYAKPVLIAHRDYLECLPSCNEKGDSGIKDTIDRLVDERLTRDVLEIKRTQREWPICDQTDTPVQLVSSFNRATTMMSLYWGCRKCLHNLPIEKP